MAISTSVMYMQQSAFPTAAAFVFGGRIGVDKDAVVGSVVIVADILALSVVVESFVLFNA